MATPHALTLPAEDDERLAAALRRERLHLYQAGAWSALGAQVVIALLLLWVLGPATPWSALAGWLAVLVPALVARLVVSMPIRIARGDAAASPSPALLWRTRLAVAATGLGWGLAGVLLFPQADLQAQVLFAFVLAGLAAGALTLTAFDVVGALLFVVPTLAPFGLRLLAAGGPEAATMATMMLLFIGILGLAGRRAQRQVVETVAAREADRQRAESLLDNQRRQQQLSEELRRQSEALAVTLDSMEQGILSLDRDGRTRFYNRRLVELLDIPEAFFAAAPTMDDIARYQLEHGHYGPDFELVDGPMRGVLADWFAGRREQFPASYLRRTHGGAVLEVKTRYLDGGAMVRTFSDVTAFFAASEQAERASRAKSEFLSAMSHELRTPLNAVLGFAQLLEADARHPLVARQQGHVAQILRAGEHLLELINDVLDLARVEAGKQKIVVEPVALDALLDECLDLVRPLADERAIRLDRDALLACRCEVVADRTRLKQVLLNVLSNAIKYNRDGGAVTVICRDDPGELHIGIADTGAGIAPEQRARLFSAFDRLGAEGGSIEGAGIGLTLSRRMLELMNGRIDVDSEVGRGSTFWIHLPRAMHTPLPASAPSPAASAEATNAADAPARRVLYIEDNPVNMMVMEAALEREPGLRFFGASLPEAGLDLARTVCPDVILLDIQLPGIDGFEVLRRLRASEATSRIPVVAVSASAMSGEIERALAAGFDDYLTKPVDLEQLRACVHASRSHRALP